MKKIIIIFLLLIIIFTAFGYVFLKYSAQNTGSNFFNDNLRYKFARYPLMRQILGLHFDGDARADYLGLRYKTIKIKIVPMNGLYLSENTAKIFSDKIRETTVKPTAYSYYPNVSYKPTSSSEDLQKELDSLGYAWSPTEAVVYVLIASQKNDDSNLLGSTVGENGIVLFENTLANNMRSDSPKNLENYTATLLLHEFGHQIGLEHNSLPDCLMNEKTEFSDQGRLLEKLDDFCDFEKQEIKKMVF
jgi:predicted Zn-dependent protease